VDAAVSSARVGVRLPSPELFRAALAAAGVGAREAIMVGPDGGRDALGAMAAGLVAARLWRPEDHPGQPAPPARPGVIVLRSLADLVPLVGPG
jgi:FMN phosphatase YigB (HAD superfamily)